MDKDLGGLAKTSAEANKLTTTIEEYKKLVDKSETISRFSNFFEANSIGKDFYDHLFHFDKQIYFMYQSKEEYVRPDGKPKIHQRIFFFLDDYYKRLVPKKELAKHIEKQELADYNIIVHGQNLFVFDTPQPIKSYTDVARHIPEVNCLMFYRYSDGKVLIPDAAIFDILRQEKLKNPLHVEKNAPTETKTA